MLYTFWRNLRSQISKDHKNRKVCEHLCSFRWNRIIWKDKRVQTRHLTVTKAPFEGHWNPSRSIRRMRSHGTPRAMHCISLADDEAIECYDTAIEVEPQLVRAWYNKKLALDVQLQKAQKRLTQTHVRAKEDKGTSRDGSL